MSNLKINDILKISFFFLIFDPITTILVRLFNQILLMLPEPYFVILKLYIHITICCLSIGCIPHSLWVHSQNFTPYSTNRRETKLDADLLTCVLLLYLNKLHALGIIYYNMSVPCLSIENGGK